MANFDAVAANVAAALERTPGPYFLPEFSIADVVFTPYIERMRASLYYYKVRSISNFAISPLLQFPTGSRELGPSSCALKRCPSATLMVKLPGHFE